MIKQVAAKPPMALNHSVKLMETPYSSDLLCNIGILEAGVDKTVIEFLVFN
jgi:hypothetical protein